MRFEDGSRTNTDRPKLDLRKHKKRKSKEKSKLRPLEALSIFALNLTHEYNLYSVNTL